MTSGFLALLLVPWAPGPCEKGRESEVRPSTESGLNHLLLLQERPPGNETRGLSVERKERVNRIFTLTWIVTFRKG